MRNNYSIEKMFFNRNLVNVPKTTVVANGVERVPEVSVEDMKTQERFKIPMAISVELMRFGKILSPLAFYGISQLVPGEQIALASSIKKYFTELYCDDNYSTLFGDFPNTVLKMSETEMLLHQIMHYWGASLGFEYWPNATEGNDSESKRQDVKSVISCCCKEKYDVIDAGSADDLADALVPLLASQQSLTQRDKDDIKTFYTEIDTLTLSPDKKLQMKNLEIPFKETLCIVAATCLDSQVIRDINDALRVAIFMSGGDISLPAMPKAKDLGWRKAALTKEDKKPWTFKNFSNPQTRQLMSSINEIVKTKHNAISDAKKYAMRWIRLGEKLHPMSAKNQKKYPNAYKLFDALRNHAKEISTFGSRLEMAKTFKDLDVILDLLKQRPGEFARQLDWLVRTFSGNIGKILSVFADDVVKNISTKLLYELAEHFNSRKEDQEMRFVFIKGARKPVDLPLLEALDKESVDFINTIIVKELVSRMSKKEDLTGVSVMLDDSLKNIMLPKNMRSVNDGVKQVARGTKTPLPAGADLLRFFLFWKDETGHEDLDLSTYFYDSKFVYKSQISWNGAYKLFDDKHRQYAQFSGDVRHKRGNCAEYVDVDINVAVENDARYLVAVARDFNSNSFKTGFGGVMARNAWGTPGEVTWAPATVENGFKICSTTQNVVLCIIDLKERQLIYVDEDINGRPMGFANSGSDFITSLLKRYVNNNAFFNALTLLETYFNACGATVEVATPSKAKVIKKNIELEVKKMESEENPDVKKIDEYKRTNRVITFDEIADDYSKLLEYMF